MLEKQEVRVGVFATTLRYVSIDVVGEDHHSLIGWYALVIIWSDFIAEIDIFRDDTSLSKS